MRSTIGFLEAALTHRRWGPWLRLSTGVAVIGSTWCCGLPYLARERHVQAAQRWLDANELDVSAMFYNELPALDRSLTRMHSLHRRDQRLLWQVRVRTPIELDADHVRFAPLHGSTSGTPIP